MENDNKLADGLFYYRPHEKAPDFVLADLSFHVQRIVTWLESQETQDGFVKVQALQPKDSSKKPYCKINDYVKPDGADNATSDAGSRADARADNGEEEDPENENLPF